MPTVIKMRIRDTALRLLKAAPGGLRYSELHRGVCEVLPDVAPNTVASEIYTLRHTLPPGGVEKGLYRHPEFVPRSD